MSAMTEEEARTKWCPHVVASHTNPRGGFKPGQKVDPNDHVCIASRCMAWRSVAHNPQRRWRVEWRGETTTYFWDPSTHSEYADAKVEEMKPDVEPRGYCGLAGRPE